jgi:hypothetical protein
VTQDYFTRSDGYRWREAIEEFILRERIEAAFEAVKNDMTFTMQAYWEGLEPGAPDEMLGDAGGSGTGPLVKKKSWLQQVDMSARIPAGAPGAGTSLVVHNLTKATSTPPIPLNQLAILRHEHFVAPTHFPPLMFDVNDQVAITLIGTGGAMSGLNVILYFHKDEEVV